MPFLATAFALILLSINTVIAQTLPPPTRTVYKCDLNGKPYYSDAPCLGAKKIDIEPTRGLNKSTGKERIGKDVQHEKHRELIAEAVRPVTGMDSKRFDQAGRRSKLTSDQQRMCKQLDSLLPQAELKERNSDNSSKLAIAQQELHKLRLAYREGRCE